MFTRMRSNRRSRIVLLIIILVALWVTRATWLGNVEDAPAPADSIEAAFETGRSGDWFEVGGTVDKTLADDREGSRHQRFILRLGSGHTVLVAHNIDLADRVPLERGDRVSLRGEYEFTAKGGVMHWTHHDPQGRKQGGWVEHAGRRYK